MPPTDSRSNGGLVKVSLATVDMNSLDMWDDRAVMEMMTKKAQAYKSLKVQWAKAQGCQLSQHIAEDYATAIKRFILYTELTKEQHAEFLLRFA